MQVQALLTTHYLLYRMKHRKIIGTNGNALFFFSLTQTGFQATSNSFTKYCTSQEISRTRSEYECTFALSGTRIKKLVLTILGWYVFVDHQPYHFKSFLALIQSHIVHKKIQEKKNGFTSSAFSFCLKFSAYGDKTHIVCALEIRCFYTSNHNKCTESYCGAIFCTRYFTTVFPANPTIELWKPNQLIRSFG